MSKLQSDSIDAFLGKIETFVKNIKSDFTSSKNRLSSIAQREYDRLFAELEAKGVYAIDNKKTKDYLKSAANAALSFFEERLNEGIADEIDRLKDNVDKRKKELEQQIVIKSVNADVFIDFGSDIHNALKKLETTIGDVAYYVMGIISTALTAFAIASWWNPGGWIAGAIASVFVIFGGRDRKADAKKDKGGKTKCDASLSL